MVRITDYIQDRGLNWYVENDGTSECARLIVITYGKCLYWIGGEKLLAERGDFVYIPPHTPFYGKCVPTVFHEKLVFAFTWTDGEERLPLFPLSQGIRSRAGCYELCVERLRAASTEWEDGVPYAHLRMSAAVLETIALWSRELDRGKETDVSMQHAEKMKSYIQTNYRDKVTKEKLGDSIGRSPNHAASLFRRVTGQTISDYVHAVRMRTAAYMLRESLLTIAEISEYLGYADVSYFQRVFKRTYGCPPSGYLSERRVRV
ncbi:helix-turn-helix domain-containing protein [Paenibacillus sp. LHD-117]|uniref:helix-turn-helix transcriptional regulator n=1 Tax=Paenibacillus sp. LHD-117 TaxID=3071412 RepID=UPI0027DFCCC7|nr:helix-turn-helix domain-containing protein [Paenibacillus sp. LHD-117]MDQ6418025.1 helix-turn-helix domain-containing protein [Paenibacillus sp. LHD-117]